MYVWEAEIGVSEVGVHKNEDLIKNAIWVYEFFL